jgi:hypothetical protein
MFLSLDWYSHLFLLISRELAVGSAGKSNFAN